MRILNIAGWLSRAFHVVFCFLGIHGPGSYGLHSSFRSKYMGQHLRRCQSCGKLWLAMSDDALCRPTDWVEI